MNLDSRAALVKAIYEKTVNGKLEWVQTVVDDTFLVSFPSSSIDISKTKINNDDIYLLSIYNAEAELVESIADTDIEDYLSDSYTLLKEIFERARTKALKVDDTIQQILSDLEKIK